MNIPHERFVINIDLRNVADDHPLKIFNNRESFDNSIEILSDEKDNGQYISINDILKFENQNYKVTDITFRISEYTLREGEPENIESFYVDSPVTPTNCLLIVSVEKQS